MSLRGAWRVTRDSVKEFFAAKILKLSASLAFFTIFSLPGLLIILLWVSENFYGNDFVEGSLYRQLEVLMGHSAAAALQSAVSNAASAGTSGGIIATVIGIVSLVLGATSVFGQIQDSINAIWQLKARPRKGMAIVRMIINRLISFSMVITLGFILLVSLFISGAMDILMDHLMQRYPTLTVVLVYLLNTILTFGIAMLIFAAIFKVLPDARIEWKHVWIGAMVTAFLFIGGKYLISYFLANNRMTSAYGAAGSIIAILLWVYYSSAILYFGAAFTHVYVQHGGSRIYPNSYAVWVKEIEVESKGKVEG